MGNGGEALAKAHRGTKTLTFNHKATGGFFCLPHLTTTSAGNRFIANTIRQKKMKCVQIENEEMKLFFFTHAMTFYRENPKETTNKKHLQQISGYSKVTRYKVNVPKLKNRNLNLKT